MAGSTFRGASAAADMASTGVSTASCFSLATATSSSKVRCVVAEVFGVWRKPFSRRNSAGSLRRLLLRGYLLPEPLGRLK